MQKRNLLFLSIGLFGLMVGVSGTVRASAIDLNDFFADPTVTVAPDGTSAVLAEDPSLIVVLLFNDPGLGDPNVVIPGPGVSLVFDFNFTEGAGEDDGFWAFILDAATGSSIGAPFEFFAQDTNSGIVSFDLASLVGKTLGLEFQLASGFGDTGFTSSATITNVRLEQPITAPEFSGITYGIPNFGWIFGLSGGLLGMAVIRRKYSKG